MNKTPKNNIYEVPEGYFDSLSDRIIRKKNSKARQAFIYRLTAAAAIAVGFALFAVKLSLVPDVSFQTEIDQEVEFYINSGYWGAEDVISFSDNLMNFWTGSSPKNGPGMTSPMSSGPWMT